MKILNKLDTLDNINDGNTRKLITKTESSGAGNAVTSVSVSGDTITYVKETTFVVPNDLPTKTSDLINDSGFTTNTGTIEGVSINGTSIATSGIANITSVPASILTGAIPSAVTATTQSSGDNSTKIATTAYVDIKPTILSGTSDPTSSLGKNGDIYIQYEE